jgi:hypothetical protein
MSLSTIERLSNHVKGGAPWADEVAVIEVAKYEHRWAAREAELDAIYREKPLYNVQDRNHKPRRRAKSGPIVFPADWPDAEPM